METQADTHTKQARERDGHPESRYRYTYGMHNVFPTIDDFSCKLKEKFHTEYHLETRL